MSDNLARISLFPQTPITKNERETTPSNSVVSSTTRARAREKVEVYYRECFNAPCPPRVEREVVAWLSDGVDPDMIMEAMDEATMIPRPSWLYARAIIQRCIGEGVTTVDAYYERQSRWQQRRR